MQHLTVNFTTMLAGGDILDISRHLNKAARYDICVAPWHEYPYKPSASFAISYSSESIYLKYFVRENHIRVLSHAINSPVWEDSCVEFFIAFDDTGYYNLEFNCAGTALAGFGSNKYQRSLLPPEIIAGIDYHSQINSRKDEGQCWELTLNIPFSVFAHHQLVSLEGRQCQANFYKCGDLLPMPHFLAWSGIDTPQPDFHQPSFFGQLSFV